jgi:hypothetical protein
MRFIKFALLATVVLPSLASGGQIDGTLFQNGQPVANKNIQIRCEPNVLESKITDPRGTFRFYVKQSGVCFFEVVDLGLVHRIYSYRGPVRYDFDLVRQPEGRYMLRRH